MDKMISIEYNGKTVQKKEICPGIVESGSAYLIKCSVSGDWCYCNQERFNKLVAKHGSQEALGLKYASRDGKRTQSGKEPLPKKEYKVREVTTDNSDMVKNAADELVPRRFIAKEVAPPDYDENREGFVKRKKVINAEAKD